jgi:CHAT domain-containing protein
VISSYIPTRKSLSHARKRAFQPSGKIRSHILIAGMPRTPKMSSFQHIEREMEDLCNLIPKSHEKFIFIPTTKAEVLEHLQTCQIAHLACHGQSNDSEPLQSQLLLQEWEINPLRVADLMALKFENGLLQYF